jgi:hypothetical protein
LGLGFRPTKGLDFFEAIGGVSPTENFIILQKGREKFYRRTHGTKKEMKKIKKRVAITTKSLSM